MQSNFEINKWFCLWYSLAFLGVIVVGCAEERLREPIQVVLTDVEPVRPSQSATPAVPYAAVPESTKETTKPEVAKKATTRPATIIMYESSNCVWCKFWWSTNRVNWEKAGWRVERKDRTAFAGSGAPSGVPFFEVWDTEKTILVTKLLDYAAYKEAGGK